MLNAFHLCKYTILSVVLLQNMLEGQLNLLLEFFHLHFFLEPGPVWRGDIVTTIIPMKLTLISEPVV